jgi:hypothetical protein
MDDINIHDDENTPLLNAPSCGRRFCGFRSALYCSCGPVNRCVGNRFYQCANEVCTTFTSSKLPVDISRNNFCAISRVLYQDEETVCDQINYRPLSESLFFATEAFTVFQWCRTSDRIGRKPILSLRLYVWDGRNDLIGAVLSRTISALMYVGRILRRLCDLPNQSPVSVWSAEWDYWYTSPSSQLSVFCPVADS